MPPQDSSLQKSYFVNVTYFFVGMHLLTRLAEISGVIETAGRCSARLILKDGLKLVKNGRNDGV